MRDERPEIIELFTLENAPGTNVVTSPFLNQPAECHPSAPAPPVSNHIHQYADNAQAPGRANDVFGKFGPLKKRGIVAEQQLLELQLIMESY